MFNRKSPTDLVDSICLSMILLGTLGNILGLIVFLSKKFRRTSYGRLAAVSLLINLFCVYRYSLLLHSKTRRWISDQAGLNWLVCKLYRLSSCLRILSSLVTVVWTYERFVFVTDRRHLFSRTSSIRLLRSVLIVSSICLVVVLLTGPTIYFYESRLVDNDVGNVSRPTPRKFCSLKSSTTSFWRAFLEDVRFGLNYTTLRSVFSEIIPSLLVFLFNSGIIYRVVRSSISLRTRPVCRSICAKTSQIDEFMVHNRPRTSWMNLVLVLHSCLFFFSSLTATLVHWSTKNVLLSHWTSVVILANCSLNFYVYCLSGKSFRREIRLLFDSYFQFFIREKLLKFCRSQSQQEVFEQAVRMRRIRSRTKTSESLARCLNVAPDRTVSRCQSLSPSNSFLCRRHSLEQQ